MQEQEQSWLFWHPDAFQSFLSLVGTCSSQKHHGKNGIVCYHATTSVNRAKSNKPWDCIRPHQSPEGMAALPNHRQIQMVEKGEKNLTLSLPFAITSFKNKASTQKVVMCWNKTHSFYKYLYIRIMRQVKPEIRPQRNTVNSTNII